jgi:hypothetical protein
MPLPRLTVLFLLTTTAASAQEPIDRATLARIRDEGLNRPQVGAVFNQLTNVLGPRLAGTPAYKRAADWTEQRLRAHGLKNVHQESWPFGRGWELKQFTFELVEPWYMPLVGYPEAWTPSTSGELFGAPVYLGALADSNAVKAEGTRLRGAIVLGTQPQPRFIVSDRAEPSLSDTAVRIGAPSFINPRSPLPSRALANLLGRLGAGVMLRPSQGQHGTMFVLGNSGARNGPDGAVPSVIVQAEQYNMIVNAMQAGSPVKLRVNVQTEFLTADTNGYNVIAEIPGIDPVIGDEVVLLGAHLDSWHSATGATDNADAVASLVEAMRILTTLGVQPRRTIRIALWGGEEEGLLGSRAHVQRHYAGPANAAARDKLVVYLNSDPGSGPIFGWYMEENAAAKAVFDAWLEPFKDLGARRNVMARIGSTDHVAFTAIGVPAFNSLQDYVDYDQREHHTNVDYAERVSVEDLKQNAIVLASFAWLAANRGERVPRP